MFWKSLAQKAITNELTAKGAFTSPHPASPLKVKMIESTSSFAAPPNASTLLAMQLNTR